MTVHRYELDEFISRIGGDLRKTVEPYMQQMVFAVITDIYNDLVENTPIDTGYLRLSLTTALNGSPAFQAPPRAKNAVTGQYTNAFRYSGKVAAETLGDFKLGDTVSIGYTANYAPYVEDRYHMIKGVQSRLKQYCQNAVNAVRRGLS